MPRNNGSVLRLFTISARERCPKSFGPTKRPRGKCPGKIATSCKSEQSCKKIFQVGKYMYADEHWGERSERAYLRDYNCVIN